MDRKRELKDVIYYSQSQTWLQFALSLCANNIMKSMGPASI